MKKSLKHHNFPIRIFLIIADIAPFNRCNAFLIFHAHWDTHNLNPLNPLQPIVLFLFYINFTHKASSLYNIAESSASFKKSTRVSLQYILGVCKEPTTKGL